MSDINNGAMTGADRINHATSIAAAKRTMGAAASSPISSATHNRPLYGLGEAIAEITRSSGIGREAPEGPTRGEQLSDADGPTQDVKVENGKAVHRKSTPGGLRQTPIGATDEDAPYFIGGMSLREDRLRDRDPGDL